MNDPRGSIWRKWDLHVHTPASLVHRYGGAEPWARFLSELEALPSEFKAIGINDYLFLDGYRRILEERKKGRLKNIELLLPVIELRLDKFGGSAGDLSRVNCHIIFSDTLGPDLIEQQFLNALSSRYVLSPQYDYLRKSKKWAAVPTKDSLADLGRLIIETVPAEKRSDFESPLVEGFNNLCISFESLNEVLGSHYFQGKVVTAVGKTEWANIKWNDQSIAEKKTIINDADLVFMSAQTPLALAVAKKHLLDSGVNHCLLDCSDAHTFSNSPDKDRLGKCFTWLKADPTFTGLLQALNEPEDRIFLGEIPSSILHVRNNSTKYMCNLKIGRKPEASIGETWFHNEMPLNSGLIAIIGNKGKGKSALTDILGLLCNTRQNEHFTFLSSENFRQPKNNKSKHFTATLTWESGAFVTKGLDSAVDSSEPELAKYVPQNFLERICTQLGRIEETDFDRELKKVIFSHVADADRLGKDNLDDLIAYRTAEASARIDLLRSELNRINGQILDIEEQNTPEFKLHLENLIKQKQLELEAHDKAKPIEIHKPENDPEKQKQIAEVAQQVDSTKLQITILEEDISRVKTEQAKLASHISVADKLLARVDNVERQAQAFIRESADEFRQIGIPSDSVVRIFIDRNILVAKRQQFSDTKANAGKELDAFHEGTLANKKESAENALEELKAKLDEPNKKFQEYAASQKMWEQKRIGILGGPTEIGTLGFMNKQLADLVQLPAKLTELGYARLAKAKEIHAVIRHLADTYRELYAPVHAFIEKRPLAKEKFNLNFEVGIVDTGFENAFFDFISHGVSGTFCGIEDGHKMLAEILQHQDFGTETGIESFLSEITDCLQHDKRPGGGPVRAADQLRRGKEALDLFNTIFGLDYLKPRYALRMGDKELLHLSPGERGTLLLVFYLLVDKGDIPLVIDQPEENLDNQTVYELLVPCMKEAKQRRQILIVTHNPNLAVVCDAEQVIYADLDKKDNYRMNYVSGAIENPNINKAIVDVLEGTMPAFDNRDSKYQK